jgi:MGT family glycosyltransferase
VARFLFTVWPFPGHIHPNIAVAHALHRLDNEVGFYTGSAARHSIEGEGFIYFPFQAIDEALVQNIVLSVDGIMAQRGHPFQLKSMWRDLLFGTVPSQLADLDAVLSRWTPEVIVCDPIMWGPILILGETRKIPVAVFSYTAACVLPGRDGPLLGVSLPRPYNSLTRLRAQIIRTFLKLFTRNSIKEASELRESYGLPPLRSSVTEFTGQLPLYLMPSTPEFDYRRNDLPPSVNYVGPCLWNKPADQPPPEWLSRIPKDYPLIYVSEGTIPGKVPVLLRAAAEGLGNLPMQIVMTTGTHRTPIDLGLGDVANNIRMEQWVPLSDLLPRTDLVVTTGGSGTVLGALREGIPLLVVPTAWDQPENAWRVVDAGAGLRIPWQDCTPVRLREAVKRLLGEPSFRDNARRLAADFNNYGGAAQAAELLEDLANQHAPKLT